MMENPSISRFEDPPISAERRESHWLPALRPDSLATAVTDLSQSSSDGVTHEESMNLQQKPRAIVQFSEEGTSLPETKVGGDGNENANFFDRVQRSTSFPTPTESVSKKSESTEHPSSWEAHPAESITAEVENLVNGDQQHQSILPDETIATIEVPTSTSEILLTSTAEHLETSEEITSDRFDEGVPLLGAVQDEPEAALTLPAVTAAQTDPFNVAATEDEGSFFTQLNTADVAETQPPSLARKSTADVFKTLDFKDAGESDSPVDFFQQLETDPVLKDQETTEMALQPDGDDPWAAALDDEDDFLIEDADDLLPDSEPGSPSSFMASLQQEQSGISGIDLNAPSHVPGSATNPYAPHQPSTSAMTSLSSTQVPSQAQGNVGLGRPGLGQMKSFQSHLQQPGPPQRAESFADQSKGGYKSPYDLPLDISKTKKRPQVSRIVSQPQTGVAPPPRSSSMNSDKVLQPPFDSTNTTPVTAVSASVSARPGTAPQRVASNSSFFEELPVNPRPRASPNPGRYTPTQPSIPAPTPPAASSSASPPRQRIGSTPSQPSIPENAEPYTDFQLRPPERLDPYANVATQNTTAPLQAATSRYSPAPGSVSGAPKPTPSPRYSPVPPTQPPSAPGRYATQPPPTQATIPSPPSNARYASQPPSAPAPSVSPFQPRTSSPLAYQTKPPEIQSNLMPPPPPPNRTVSANATLISSQVAEQVNQTAGLTEAPVLPQPKSISNSYTPEFTPPQRSQTQSPGRQAGPRPAFPHITQGSFDRPASAHGMISVLKQAATYVPTVSATSNARQFETIDFVMPSDGSETDPLERWKGAPIFNFGFGGQTITSFPTRTPRFSSGMLKPQTKAGPGDVKNQKLQDILPITSHVLSFPGPLRGKSKKKDVLSWLATSITRLEAESPSFLGLAQTLPDPRKRHEEKVILWKLVKILVEFDGHFENPEALKAINVVLTPEVHAIDETTATHYSEAKETGGIYRPRGASARLESLNPVAVENIRKHLLKGDRKDAVWLAVDNRLWSHALLMASTLEQAVWKQVVQEFVRQEVKSVGSNTESLAAIYEVFGGNMQDSIDQLVSPSARAGLQMVSTVDSSGPVRNALDGLDKWKETLAMVLNNRCRDDHTALLTLARLLADYGRVEAAHICFLFAKNPSFASILGGLDDPQASIVLLGVDQRSQSGVVHHDEDAILLTEVYEFATCTLAGASTAIPLPYLAPYKLERAKLLADHGQKAQAQAYCDAVAAGLKSTTKVSPYYHPILLTELDELSNRLKQIPVQGGKWMSKPSIEKVSGSIFSKFTNFVAGEDSDAASQGSGREAANADVGPFANVSGSPNLSRSGSQTDLYGTYAPTAPATQPTMAGSRYAPNGLVSARSSAELVRGRPSLDSQRSPPGTSYGNDPRQSIYSPMAPSSQNQSPARSVGGYQPSGASPGQQYGSSPGYSHYQATPPQSSYLSNPATFQSSVEEEQQQTSSYEPTAPQPDLQSPYTPAMPQSIQQLGSNDNAAFGNYLAPQNQFSSTLSADVPAAEASEQAQPYGYEPPADTGYVPYQPEPDAGDEDQAQKPKKKSFMDDDTDEFANNSSFVQQPSSSTGDSTARRKANDEAADAAFRAAAEADAQRAKEAAAAKRSSGWFGGWLGGAKKADASLDSKPSGAEPKVHQVKLGESKMKLYYDKDLKKWVNPDDPDSAKAKSATPPPPRMGGTPGPPRAGGSAPPPALSRSSTPASASGLPPSSSDGIAAILPPNVNASLGLSKSAAASPVGLPPTPGSAGLPTPSRTPTSATSTGGIDDLLGPATGTRKVSGRAGKKARGGRYVDVMAK